MFDDCAKAAKGSESLPRQEKRARRRLESAGGHREGGNR